MKLEKDPSNLPLLVRGLEEIVLILDKEGSARLYDEVAVFEKLKKIQAMLLEGYTLRLIRSKLSGK